MNVQIGVFDTEYRLTLFLKRVIDSHDHYIIIIIILV